MITIPYYESSNFVFSNFSAHAVLYKGILYPTVEHAYHASKFENVNIRDQITNSRSPLEALAVATTHTKMRISNWNEIKIEVLYSIVKEKVLQHEEVKHALLQTGNEEIIEDNPHDDFWGNGLDGNGQNQMGKILMRIRDELELIG